MTDHRKILWKILAFSISMQWLNTCPAESDPPESMRSSGIRGTASPASGERSLLKSLFDWKLPETMQIHGFASQSYLYTTGNNFFGHSTNTGSLDFTEMGINGSWRPLSNLQTSMQVVYRRAGRTDESDLRLDFGFLDYSFLSDAENLAGLRLGRVVNPYGLYNDTRDMPFTRPSIFLPQSIYFDVNRQLALSGDGIQLYGEHRSKIGDFLLQINGVYPRTNDPDLKQVIAPGVSGKLDGEPSWVGRLMYEWDGGKVRLGVTSAELNAKYNPRGGPVNLESGSFSFSPILFSAQYNAEDWSLTGEYAIRHSDFDGFGPFLPDNNSTGESYYIQGSYRFTEKLEGFVRYDALYWNTSDRNGKKFAAAALSHGVSVPAHRRFAKDFATGLRWDITPSIMARVEYHYVDGTGWISELENTNLADTKQYWSLFALSLSFRF
jgi:hypothetical protein